MPQNNRFVCQTAGCGRSFSRQEHLQRHVFNHTDGEYTCDRCRTVFKRPDLLERHMARHRQKDAEGGTLMTRKRLWKDSDGRIVNRPAKEARTAAVNAPGLDDPSFPPSPPKSSSDIALSPAELNAGSIQGFQFGSDLPIEPVTTSQNSADDQLFWDTTVQSVYDSSYSNGLFDDVFMPDTASSFNMPYTTMNNYNWLFDLSLDPLLGNFENAKSDQPIQSSTGTIDSTHAPQIQPSTDTSLQTMKPRETFESSIEQAQQNCRQPTSLERHDSFVDFGRNGATETKTAKLESLMDAPMSLINLEADLPKIDDLAYERILDLIEFSRPTAPDGSLVTIEHPLLALSCLQHWLDLFFTRFNTAYPLIHSPTFSPGETEPILLTSMILLGATYAEKDAHQLAVCIHDVLRPQIFSNPGFTAKPELWVLQAILLTECLGKSRGGQKQHDMSHLFHGLLINLIRRSDCQSVQPEADLTSQDKSNVETKWQTWATREQAKRLAQLCFVWDVQHAVLFSQSLCMSAFELRSTLPCDQAVWEAESAIEWQKALSQQRIQPSLLLSVLKGYLCDKANRPQDLNSLSRVVILHGLMSIAWDLTRRDQTSLGIIGDSLVAGSWKDRIARAYDVWKSDFDAYNGTLHQMLQRYGDATKRRQLFENFESHVVSYNAMYHSAQIILLAEVLDLQIFAGARHILGRPVSKIDYVRSQKIVKRWANEETAKAASAAIHAAHLLKDAFSKNAITVTGDLFHHPWTLFLANLTIWSFFHAKRDLGRNSAPGDDEMIWDINDDMKQLLNKMTSATPSDVVASGKMSTAGLTAVVSKHLSKVRWGVIHDGMLVLKGLVPWRLINDDDGRM